MSSYASVKHWNKLDRNDNCIIVGSIIPPLYDSLDNTFAYYEALAAYVPQAPLLAYLLYPTIDSVALVHRLLELPSFGGAKYTGPNMHELRRIIDQSAGRLTIFSGMDEQSVYAANRIVLSTLKFVLHIVSTCSD